MATRRRFVVVVVAAAILTPAAARADLVACLASSPPSQMLRCLEEATSTDRAESAFPCHQSVAFYRQGWFAAGYHAKRACVRAYFPRSVPDDLDRLVVVAEAAARPTPSPGQIALGAGGSTILRCADAFDCTRLEVALEELRQRGTLSPTTLADLRRAGTLLDASRACTGELCSNLGEFILASRAGTPDRLRFRSLTVTPPMPQNAVRCRIGRDCRRIFEILRDTRLQTGPLDRLRALRMRAALRDADALECSAPETCREIRRAIEGMQDGRVDDRDLLRLRAVGRELPENP